MKIFVTYFNFKKQAKNFFQKIIKFKNPKAYVLEQNQRDFFFNQKYFAKFNNIFLTQGRKSKSQHFLNRLHFSTKNALHLSLIFIIFRIIEKLKMQVELLPFRQSGRLIYIPTILPFLRQKTNILKLLKKSFLSRQEVTLIEKLIGEISDLLLGNKCIMVQKVNKLYEIAIYSQPNMHFRWSHK